jgi:eukaryotic-like serine/threonine-protein kinase
MDEGKKTDDSYTVFIKELDILSYYKGFIANQCQEISKEQILEEFEKLIRHYESLLKNAIKITRIGDVSQSKLLKAKEKIETLNDQLIESEKNIRELNTILMFYIKETDR